MEAIKRLIAIADRWQRTNRVAGPAYGMVKKFGDDRANLFVVALGWYGFTAIYPLLLVVVTILGYIGQESLGHTVVKTLQQFPVIGSEFKPGSGSQLHGSVLALVIGLIGLLYGAQGVTQTASQAFDYVWDPSELDRPGFLPRLGRSLAGLILIGVAFIVTAVFASVATGSGHGWPLRVLVLIGLFVVNVGFFLGTFRVMTSAGDATVRQLVPGAILGSVGFTALTTVGAGLITRQLRHSSNTYGALASIIGVVTFLLLLSKISLYAAELNPVLAKRLWPRALPTGEPTEVDRAVTDAARAEQQRTDTASSAAASGG